MYKILLRYNFLILLSILLFLPAVLFLTTSLFGKDTLRKSWSPHYHLWGVTEITEQKPLFTFKSFASHEIQEYYESFLTNNFPLRSFFIRLNNQIYYSLFKKSYSESGVIIVGKSDQLISRAYIDAYCNSFSLKQSQLIEWANKLKILNDFFKQQNKSFIYVITPSKAEYMPEAIPDRFHCNNHGHSLYITEMAKLLDERKVNYVNGSTLMVSATNEYKLAMFPQGGIHWNMLGATIATEAILNTIQAEGYFNPNSLSFDYETKNEARDSDRDLLNLLNLMYPDPYYNTVQVNFKNITPSSQPFSMAIIGGSFCSNLFKILIDNQTFSKIAFYSYFKLSLQEYELGHPVKLKLKPDISSKEALSPILTADVVILEENVETMVSKHGKLFFDTLGEIVSLEE